MAVYKGRLAVASNALLHQKLMEYKNPNLIAWGLRWDYLTGTARTRHSAAGLADVSEQAPQRGIQASECGQPLRHKMTPLRRA